MLESDKLNNPKLYFLKKKLLGLQEQHQELNENLENLESSRNNLNQEYSSIIRHLKLEERMKGKVRVLEEVAREKEKELRAIEEQKAHTLEIQNELDHYFENREEVEELLAQHVGLSTDCLLYTSPSPRDS